jgi:hypothetical protein
MSTIIFVIKKEGKMGEACTTNGRSEKSIQNMWRKT